MTEQDVNYGLWLSEYYDKIMPSLPNPSEVVKFRKDDNYQKMTINIQQSHLDFLSRLGGGNRSYGLEKLLKEFKFNTRKPDKLRITTINILDEDKEKLTAAKGKIFTGFSDAIRILTLFYRIKCQEVKQQQIIDETMVVF